MLSSFDKPASRFPLIVFSLESVMDLFFCVCEVVIMAEFCLIGCIFSIVGESPLVGNTHTVVRRFTLVNQVSVFVALPFGAAIPNATAVGATHSGLRHFSLIVFSLILPFFPFLPCLFHIPPSKILESEYTEND